MAGFAAKKKEVKDDTRQFVRRLLDMEMNQELSRKARAGVVQTELLPSLCPVDEESPEEVKQNFRDNLKMRGTILETRTLPHT